MLAFQLKTSLDVSNLTVEACFDHTLSGLKSLCFRMCLRKLTEHWTNVMSVLWWADRLASDLSASSSWVLWWFVPGRHIVTGVSCCCFCPSFSSERCPCGRIQHWSYTSNWNVPVATSLCVLISLLCKCLCICSRFHFQGKAGDLLPVALAMEDPPPDVLEKISKEAAGPVADKPDN